MTSRSTPASLLMDSSKVFTRQFLETQGKQWFVTEWHSCPCRVTWCHTGSHYISMKCVSVLWNSQCSVYTTPCPSTRNFNQSKPPVMKEDMKESPFHSQIHNVHNHSHHTLYQVGNLTFTHTLQDTQFQWNMLA
jgi:hypothetical protein